jgi:hypothetical protein
MITSETSNLSSRGLEIIYDRALRRETERFPISPSQWPIYTLPQTIGKNIYLFIYYWLVEFLCSVSRVCIVSASRFHEGWVASDKPSTVVNWFEKALNPKKRRSTYRQMAAPCVYVYVSQSSRCICELLNVHSAVAYWSTWHALKKDRYEYRRSPYPISMCNVLFKWRKIKITQSAILPITYFQL